jgi:hypothetical protein
MKRIISAATEEKDTRLDDALSILKDDFDYCIAGLEKLGADGKIDDALAIATELTNGINSTISKVAKLVSSSGAE